MRLVGQIKAISCVSDDISSLISRKQTRGGFLPVKVSVWCTCYLAFAQMKRALI